MRASASTRSRQAASSERKMTIRESEQANNNKYALVVYIWIILVHLQGLRAFCVPMKSLNKLHGFEGCRCVYQRRSRRWNVWPMRRQAIHTDACTLHRFRHGKEQQHQLNKFYTIDVIAGCFGSTSWTCAHTPRCNHPNRRTRMSILPV